MESQRFAVCLAGSPVSSSRSNDQPVLVHVNRLNLDSLRTARAENWHVIPDPHRPLGNKVTQVADSPSRELRRCVDERRFFESICVQTKENVFVARSVTGRALRGFCASISQMCARACCIVITDDGKKPVSSINRISDGKPEVSTRNSQT